MHQTFDFARDIGDLPKEQRLRFYEKLAHELTTSVRGVWTDMTTTDGEKVEQMKWINELMHSVVAKASHLRRDSDDRPEEQMWLTIKWVAQQSPMAKGHIAAALKASYEFISSKQT